MTKKTHLIVFVLLLNIIIIFTLNDFNKSNSPLKIEFSEEEKETINKFIKSNFQANKQYINDYFKKDQANKFEGVSCSFCKSSIKTFKYIPWARITVKMLRLLLSIPCSFALDRNICLSAIDRYGEAVASSLIDKTIDEKIICSKMKLCKEMQYEYYPHTEYAKYILKDKPNKNQENIDKTAETWTIIQFTDIHYDPHYKEGAKAECDIPICCRANTTSNNNITAGKFGYIGKCDANKELFSSFVDKAYDMHPDFMIWTEIIHLMIFGEELKRRYLTLPRYWLI